MIPKYKQITIDKFPDCCMTCVSYAQDYDIVICIKFNGEYIHENGLCPLYEREEQKEWAFDEI